MESVPFVEQIAQKEDSVRSKETDGRMEGASHLMLSKSNNQLLEVVHAPSQFVEPVAISDALQEPKRKSNEFYQRERTSK